MTNKDNLILGGIVLAVILVVIVSLLGLYYTNTQKLNSEDETETETLTFSDNLVSETSYLEKNNNLKQANIKTDGKINLDISHILAETATTSCILYQKIFFEGEEIDFSHAPSEEEKEYLKKMNDFIGDYEITQVIVNLKTSNNEEGFSCVLKGKDETQNTMTLITKDGLTTYMDLNQAKQQFFPGSNSLSDCESRTNPDDKNLCLNALAEKNLDIDLCKTALDSSPSPTEFPYAERYQSCLIFFAKMDKDSSLCNLLEDTSRKPFKSQCYDQLSFEFCDKSLCEKIPDDAPLNDAYTLKEACLIRADQREGQC